MNYSAVKQFLSKWAECHANGCRSKVSSCYYLAVAREMTIGPVEGLKYLKVAKNAALDEDTFNFINSEIKRVKGKLNPLGRIVLLF